MPAARTRRMPAGECSAATRTMATTAISATPAAMRLTGLLYEVSHLVSTQQLHRPRHAELIKRLQIIERRLRFPHLPAEHTRFDAILGEVDDREAVLRERIESGIELNARRRTRRRTPPRRRPRFRSSANRARQHGNDWVFSKVVRAVSKNSSMAERVQIAAEKQRD